MKKRNVRLDITPADGEDYGLRTLGILFKEILQQIPAENAAALIKEYKFGMALRFTIFESRGGPHKKCAFSWEVVPDPREPDDRGISGMIPMGGVQ
jgi:hypothetical protein